MTESSMPIELKGRLLESSLRENAFSPCEASDPPEVAFAFPSEDDFVCDA